MDIDNYYIVFSKNSPFAKDDLKSYLKNSELSETEYEEYLGK
jgi:hypothetical protein